MTLNGLARWFVFSTGAAMLAACAVGPDYQRPVTSLPEHFAHAGESGLQEQSPVARFWTLFNDATLNRLVKDALAQNKDLKIAVANLRAARAGRRLAGFDLYPTVTANSSYQHARLSERELPGATPDQREGDAFDVGFDAFWELDFFGRVRRAVQAARAEEGEGLATLQDVQVSVTAEVARNYFVLCGLKDQLGVALRNADNQGQTLEITGVRLEAGRGNELDTSRADAQLQTTLSTIPPLEASIATTIHRLSVLTGRQPDVLEEQLRPTLVLPELPVLNAIGTPEALLRRRPDVRIAERNLAAATARIGVAVADLFPKVTFNGSVGFDASKAGDIGNAGSTVFGFGPSISWAAFDLGRVHARIEQARARDDAALAAYEKAVLNALEDTEDALITYGRAQVRRDTLARASAASEKAAHLARQRFEVGLTDFLNVLQAETTMLVAQDALAQTRTQTATALVAVYKALGGGWMETGPVDEPLPRTNTPIARSPVSYPTVIGHRR